MDRPPEPSSGAGDFEKLAALCDPVRRDLYFFVAEQGDFVSRRDAAAALGLRPGLAAHHLDRLSEEGLLEVRYQRLTGRSGPGAGRPAKLYRAAAERHELSVPASNARLLALLLAQAVDSAGADAKSAVDQTARRAGEAMVEGPPPRSRKDRAGRLVEVLTAYGYRPSLDDGTLLLENCPYAPMADAHREVVCGMNLALIEGAVSALRLGDAACSLDPDPARCCVRVCSKRGF